MSNFDVNIFITIAVLGFSLHIASEPSFSYLLLTETSGNFGMRFINRNFSCATSIVKAQKKIVFSVYK